MRPRDLGPRRAQAQSNLHFAPARPWPSMGAERLRQLAPRPSRSRVSMGARLVEVKLRAHGNSGPRWGARPGNLHFAPTRHEALGGREAFASRTSRPQELRPSMGARLGHPALRTYKNSGPRWAQGFRNANSAPARIRALGGRLTESSCTSRPRGAGPAMGASDAQSAPRARKNAGPRWVRSLSNSPSTREVLVPDWRQAWANAPRSH